MAGWMNVNWTVQIHTIEGTASYVDPSGELIDAAEYALINRLPFPAPAGSPRGVFYLLNVNIQREPDTSIDATAFGGSTSSRFIVRPGYRVMTLTYRDHP